MHKDHDAEYKNKGEDTTTNVVYDFQMTSAS